MAKGYQENKDRLEVISSFGNAIGTDRNQTMEDKINSVRSKLASCS